MSAIFDDSEGGLRRRLALSIGHREDKAFSADLRTEDGRSVLDQIRSASDAIATMERERRRRVMLIMHIENGSYRDSWMVPPGKVIYAASYMGFEGGIFMHPSTSMAVKHRGTPFYTRYCAGVRELERDRRRRLSTG